MKLLDNYDLLSYKIHISIHCMKNEKQRSRSGHRIIAFPNSIEQII